MTMTADSYLILGAGAIGSVLGGLLQDGGIDITYLGRGSHFQAMLIDGLHVTGLWGEHFIPPERIKGFIDPSKVHQKFKVIMLCVKSIDTDTAARQALPLLEEDGILVSMQNGLTNWEIIAGLAGEDRTVGGRVIFGADIPKPGTARVTVYADPILLGAPFAPVNDEALRSLDLNLNSAGVPTRLVSKEDIHAAIWGKVLYNSALNPLSALLEVNYGKLGERKETLLIMRTVIEEIFEVMGRRGVKVPFDGPDEYYHHFIENLLPPTVDHNSSMLQDITIGRRTEIGSLNGAISRYAKELGIKTPYNDFLTKLIKFKEEESVISKAKTKIKS